MDFFDNHYYWLNRKLLILVGQWPYQNRAERIVKRIMFACIILLETVTLGGQAINIEMDFDHCVELLSESIVTVIICVRYLFYTLNNDKIKELLENMKLTWQSLIDVDERQIFCESTEAGRLYVSHYTLMTIVLSGSGCIFILISPLLIYTPITNMSCPIAMIYLPEIFADPQKHCYPILLCTDIIIITLTVSLLASDTLYITIVYHSGTMFKIACYQLEHSFDDCMQETISSKRTYVYERIVNAVERHRNAIRFTDNIVAVYYWSNLICLMLVLVGIALTLYLTATSKGQNIKSMFSLTLSVYQMLHTFVAHIPAQQMMNNSEEILFKAYSSLWYMGRAKQQTLLLLTMHRALKPSGMVMRGLYATTLENFASEVKASFSYFTMLMSLK